MTGTHAREAKDLRTRQQEISAASRAERSDVADLLAERERRIWGEECLASERKFGSRAARLLPLVGIDGGVGTPLGQATLFQAFESRCLVLLTRGRNAGRDAGGKSYKPLREVAVEEIEPYRSNPREKR